MPDETLALPPGEPITDAELDHAALSLSHRLHGWQRQFGRWIASRKSTPRRAAQMDKLLELTGYEWTEPQRRELIGHPAFKTYVEIFRERGLREAQALVADAAPEAVRKLIWAMRRAKQQDDYRAMPNIVNPFLERALPRRDPLAAAPTQVTVTFTTQQLKALDDPLPVLEAEVVED